MTYPLPGGKTATTNATTKKDGTYAVNIKPTIRAPSQSGTSQARLVRVVDDQVADGRRVDQALTMAATRNTTTGRVLVTGTLRVTDKAGATVPKASAKVLVTYQATATTTKTVTATTKADGSYTISVKPLATGDVTAKYAGIAGWAAAAATPVTITL